MSEFAGLKIIGERINPGFKSSKALLDARDIPGLQQLARDQVAKGAEYLTVNFGQWIDHDRSFIPELIIALQQAVEIPLAFDYPDRGVQELCLKTYDPAKARGRRPIVNSITQARWDMLEALAIQPAEVILMVSERLEHHAPVPNTTVEEVVNTAHCMVDHATSARPELTPHDLIIDVSVCPLASDTEGVLRRAIESIRVLGADPVTRQCRLLVGLSNIGIMLPKLSFDARPLSVTVESAFLSLACPLGLNLILGTPGRNYQCLADADPIMRIVRESIYTEGFEALMKVQELYNGVSA